MNRSDMPPETQARRAPRPMAGGAAGDLLIDVPTVTSEQDNFHVRKLFTRDPHLASVAVVEGQHPLGLITRDTFIGQMARPYVPEFYGRKSCTAFMDGNPLLVEASTSVSALSAQAVATGVKALKDGYLITHHGKYAGYGSGFALLKALSDLQIEKNHMLTDSIHYASVIQRSFLSTSFDQLTATLDDFFLIWEPRDVVGGDAYFFERGRDGFFAAVIDCTGHGVPGAFMTLIAASSLARALLAVGPKDPASVMSETHRLIKAALRQERLHDGESAAQSDDGCDAAFIWFDAGARTLTFAGARMPLFVIDTEGNGAYPVAGDRRGVGYVDTAMNHTWTNQVIPFDEGTAFYLTTDGIIDQIGGAKCIALGKRRFAEAVTRSSTLPMALQKNALQHFFSAYQGNQERRDDVTAMGFSVTRQLLSTFGGGR